MDRLLLQLLVRFISAIWTHNVVTSSVVSTSAQQAVGSIPGQGNRFLCVLFLTVCPLKILTRGFLYPLTGKLGGTKSEMGVQEF